MANNAHQTLLDLLARERLCLVSGNLSEVARDSALKQALVDQLHFAEITPAELRHLHMVSQRNGRLLAAAVSGIKSVATRLNRPDGAVTTYDPLGRRKTLAVNPSANITRA